MEDYFISESSLQGGFLDCLLSSTIDAIFFILKFYGTKQVCLNLKFLKLFLNELWFMLHIEIEVFEIWAALHIWNVGTCAYKCMRMCLWMQTNISVQNLLFPPKKVILTRVSRYGCKSETLGTFIRRVNNPSSKMVDDAIFHLRPPRV